MLVCASECAIQTHKGQGLGGGESPVSASQTLMSEELSGVPAAPEHCCGQPEGLHLRVRRSGPGPHSEHEVSKGHSPGSFLSSPPHLASQAQRIPVLQANV